MTNQAPATNINNVVPGKEANHVGVGGKGFLKGVEIFLVQLDIEEAD